MQSQGVLSLGSAPGADRQLLVLPCHRANSQNSVHCSHSETFVSNMTPRICVLFPVSAKAVEQQRWGAAAWL